jgi:aspartate/methionine/tyrosine aminotransferase
MRPSSRLPRESAPNALSLAIDTLRRSGTPYVDLTESNPTRAGIPYPGDLLRALSAPDALRYEPYPLGLVSAREAVAADYARRGARVDPGQVVLSASTSEMYAWLFKLLCDAGESVLVPRPSYPLFEHLTRLEGVRAEPYRLEYHGRWEIDLESVTTATDATRAVLLVSPNNPTGSFASAPEVEALVRICRDRGWALIVDEVFADYRLDAVDPVTDLAARAGVLTFSMGGASKSLGLPQVKLGWTLVGGPAADRAAALDGLELIADTFLSVSTPVQVAAADLLERGAVVRAAIQARIETNLAAARREAALHPSCDLLPVEGGWSAVVRVPATRPEEQLVLDLLSRERVLVHPGYFFDFEHEAFAIVSLLVSEMAFADAFARTLRFAEAA